MSFKVEIRKKEAKSKGLPDKHYIVVRGSSHKFTPSVEKFLFRHGLNRLGITGGMETWSMMPSVTPAPIYLVALIDQKWGSSMDPYTKKLLEEAKQAHKPADGLERFLGQDIGIDAGDQALKVVAGKGVFIANCSADNKARITLLEGAGWLPVPVVSEKLARAYGSQPYMTRDAILSAGMMPFMNKDALDRQAAMMRDVQANIASSQSQEAPADFNIAAPEGLEYLPFQKVGIQMIAKSGKGGLIADDMGLGKTIQGIGILNARPDARRVLVACQANMRLKWVDEIEKWKINENLTVGHAEGDVWPDTDVVVINYDIVARHEDKIRATEWDLFLTDEAHNLKNEETKRTMTLLGAMSEELDSEDYVPPVPLAPGGQLVHLTGTPKPNRISEMWPLLSSSRPDIWGRGKRARQIFINRYEPPTLFKKKLVRNGRQFEVIQAIPGKPVREAELQLRLRASGAFVRRMKRDTPGLPQKFRTPIRMPFSLNEEERKELASINADFGNIMEGIAARGARDITPGASRKAGALIDVIEGISPGSPEFHEIARVRRNLGILKAPMSARFIIDELHEDEDLPEDARRKTVVFAHHKDVIDILERMINAEFPGSVCRYDGSVNSAKKRESLVNAFQTQKKKRVFLMSLSGATGITLTSAYRERIVEPDWSPSNMAQIEDRIWRIGQEENCDIGYLFVPNSLDLAIGSALVRKMETDERTLNGLKMRGFKSRESLNKTDKPADLDFKAAEALEAATSKAPVINDCQSAQPRLL